MGRPERRCEHYRGLLLRPTFKEDGLYFGIGDVVGEPHGLRVEVVSEVMTGTVPPHVQPYPLSTLTLDPQTPDQDRPSDRTTH